MIFSNANYGMQVTDVDETYLSNAWIYGNRFAGYYGSYDVMRYYNYNYIFDNNGNDIISSDFATGTSGPL